MSALRKGDKAYLDGLLSALDDLPDGAWRAACESMIASDPRFRGRNEYDVWLAWCYTNRVKDTKAAP